MFGISGIARQARQWRAERKRRALRRQLYELPLELQKDIGWPATDPRYPSARVISEIPGRPLV
jgi:hypothetical protein